MISNAVIFGICAMILYNTWKLSEQINELKDSVHRIVRLTITNEVHRNTVKTNTPHGFTADEWYRNTFKGGDAE